VNSSRTRPADVLAGASGLALLLVMFLPWFGLDEAVDLPGPAGTVIAEGRGLNAWEAFRYADVILFVTAIAAIALLVVRAAHVMPRWRVPLPLIVTALGALAVLLIVFRLIDPPSIQAPLSGGAADVGRRIGLYFGLLAAAGITFGANGSLGADVGR
jgi:hypothetical protein